MPSVETLQSMYDAAKAVLHEELATQLASKAAADFLEMNTLHEENAVLYFHSKLVSELCEGEETRRQLMRADINSPSFALFSKTFWYTLIQIVVAHRFLGLPDHVSPLDINPLYPTKWNDGFVDVAFDFRIRNGAVCLPLGR